MKSRTSFPFVKTRVFLTAAALAAATGLTPVAQADSVPANWWVYVHNDRAADLKALLAQGADPNVHYKNGQPALMRAVVDGAWEVFDVLAADPRTDVNAVNPANETALMYLAVAGETERARKLIARGAQVNRLGWTPLHYAASKAQMDTAKLLLAHGAMVNAPSPEGTTPIMMAGFSGRMYMVELLLEAGADITTRNLKGQNTSDWAYAAKRRELGAELAKLIDKAQQQRDAARDARDPATAMPVRDAPATPVDAQQVPQAVQPEMGAGTVGGGTPAAGTPAAGSPAAAPSSPGTSGDSPSGAAERSVGGVSGVRLNNYD